jgi:lipid-A-disaccharide synthase-like uncharacterized protein
MSLLTRALGLRRSREALVLFSLSIGCLALVVPTHSADAAEESRRLKVIAPGVARVDLSRSQANDYVYTIQFKDGQIQELTPSEFAASIYDRQTGQPWWQVFLNISSPIGIAWVTLGLLGQILFTGRMIVQWLSSEKHKRSIVPSAFWWMSLAGASMLLVYFVWRKDVIGVLGQSAGWFVYGRNLYFIYRKTSPA